MSHWPWVDHTRQLTAIMAYFDNVREARLFLKFFQTASKELNRVILGLMSPLIQELHDLVIACVSLKDLCCLAQLRIAKEQASGR